jgi:plasmid stabilization system protein ParE
VTDERRPVVRTRAAQRDLEAFVRYLAREAGERTAERFVVAYEQRLAMLARFPGLGEPLEAPAGHPMPM